MRTNNLSLMQFGLLKELCEISPRRGVGEVAAAEIIKRYLLSNQIPFTVQAFKTRIPNFVKAELYADDQKVECVGSSFVNGTFDNNSQIFNALEVSSVKSAILFHPASKGICLYSLTDFPSVSINIDEAAKVKNAKSIRGEVVVEEFAFESQNILVGNTINPRKIIFAHYDSIVGSGAIDNAGSVAVMAQVILGNMHFLADKLFVFTAAEEETISRPFGGFGFEMFDVDNPRILDNVKEIVVLDGIGVSAPEFVGEDLDSVFGMSRLDDLRNRILWLRNDQWQVLKYYHSKLDTIDKLSEEFLNGVKAVLISNLS